jgi:glutamine amidotransferase
MRIAIINFNSGNLYSIKKSIVELGHQAFICNNSEDLISSDKIILPGVGSYFNAFNYLLKFGFVDSLNELVIKKGVPILGICLGMQLFCNSSTEKKFSKGLSFVDAEVVNLRDIDCKLKVPHIGWNNITIKKKNAILHDISDNSDFYFVHDFVVRAKDQEIVLATTTHDVDFVSMFQINNIYGVQFHPEKSSNSGSQLIKNFLEL